MPVHELGGEEQEKVYYTLELLPDGTLMTLRRYSLAHLLTVFQKVYDAVTFAHSRRAIHRDLKPENVMLGTFGEFLFMNCGLAKVRGRKATDGAKGTAYRSGIQSVRVAEEDFSRTMACSIVGTPYYMSPSRSGAKRRFSMRVFDIYALGAILCHLLTRERPWTERTY